jgi:hypothetical protein
MTSKLLIEVIPSDLHYRNLRSALPVEEWDIIRRACYARAGYKCEICSGVGNAHPVECHEMWDYNDKEHIQTLVGVIALCPMCHAVKHWGLSVYIRGLEKECIRHLRSVNDWNMREVNKHVRNITDEYDRRNVHSWTQDISLAQELLKQKRGGVLWKKT